MNIFFNTIKYKALSLLKGKSEPIYTLPTKFITNFSELTPKTQEPYDLNGRQVYISAPSNDGLFKANRLTVDERVFYNADYMAHYQDWGTPLYPWVYKSDACNSFNKFRIDIYKAGRMLAKCTLPKYTWASIWLYVSMNKGDFNKPLLPIDKPLAPREYYFEIDLFETMMNPEHIAFSGHFGTQVQRGLEANSIYWCDDDKMHYVEVVWDGQGNWKWLIDSVVIQSTSIPQPTEPIYPYLLLTLAMPDDYPNIQYPVQWKVDWIKFSDNIINLDENGNRI